MDPRPFERRRALLPIYLGDDTSDEDAFAVLKG